MVVCHSLDGQNVTDDQCQDLKPLDIQICDMGSCAQGWFHSPWSRKVSASQHVVIYNHVICEAMLVIYILKYMHVYNYMNWFTIRMQSD